MIRTRMRPSTCLKTRMKRVKNLTVMKISPMIRTSVMKSTVMNLTVTKVLEKTGLTWRLKLLKMTGTEVMVMKREGERKATPPPRGENRSAGRKKEPGMGSRLKSIRATDTELLKR